MFREMILKKCNEWYSSDQCKIKEIITYIYNKGMMRDAQIESIKIYLFLKIALKNRPLNELFYEGKFNSIDIDELELKSATRDYMKNNPAAACLFEYCQYLKRTNSEMIKVEEHIRADPASLDYKRIFDEFFYNISYTDYIFSLPMGAGKTFLMSAFIYLDMYLSSIEPDNPAFAHNFVVLAPSGLKSSIIPSLKTLQKFDPTWVLDNNIVTQIRKEIEYEILEQNVTSSRSNKTKNPNCSKLALHAINKDTRGLVVITNAEKVILDKIKVDEQQRITVMDEDQEDRFANELRNMIGRIPNLSIFIDEVHHAKDEEKKLRSVVTKWAERRSVCSVIGFSGTPYLQKGEKSKVSINKISVINQEITNVVYYYPLAKGVGNFLKTPVIKSFENRENYLEIVDEGVREFLDVEKNHIYPNGTCSKIAIYSTSIEHLEENVYPRVLRICEEYNLDTSESILKYHDGNKVYSVSKDAKMRFELLDNHLSKVRIILLVGIGREGWDCKSLTSVVLPQENKGSRNNVLQTCCRPLRQVSRHDLEKAYIFLNKSNEEYLAEQLKNEQRTTISELQEGTKSKSKLIKFYNRMDELNIPEIRYYQMDTSTNIVEEGEIDPAKNIASIYLDKYYREHIIETKLIDGTLLSKSIENSENGLELLDVAHFNGWLMEISKGSFNNISFEQLHRHEKEISHIFNAITFEGGGVRYFSTKYERSKIESAIRLCYSQKRRIQVTETIQETYSELLSSDEFVREKMVNNIDEYFPDQDTIEGWYDLDANHFVEISDLNMSYHYIPYHFDSKFERDVHRALLSLDAVKEKGLEVYYNGDRFITKFQIKCYKTIGNSRVYVGKYTPDFLIVKRKNTKFDKILILETKGSIFAGDPNFLNRKNFIEEAFKEFNNEKYGYKKYDYVYIEDSIPEKDRLKIMIDRINIFFKEI